MTDTTSGALPGLRAGSPAVRPAGSRTGFSTRNLLGTKAALLTDPWSGEDDTDWARLADAQFTHDSVTASLAVARLRAAGRAAGSRRLSPSLIVRTRHPRPGRGSACPDKETP
jgi:hypothetical protein